MAPNANLSSQSPEILSIIIKDLLVDYLHEYFMADDIPSWDAIQVLLHVSYPFRENTLALLSSAFSLTREPDGSLNKDPRSLLRDVRRSAETYFEESCDDLRAHSDPFVPGGPHFAPITQYMETPFKDSAILDIYHSLREAQLTKAYIFEQGLHPSCMLRLPEPLTARWRNLSKITSMTWRPLIAVERMLMSTNVGALYILRDGLEALVEALDVDDFSEAQVKLAENIIGMLEGLQHAQSLSSWILCGGLPDHYIDTYPEPDEVQRSEVVPALRNFISLLAASPDDTLESLRQRVQAFLVQWGPLHDLAGT